jgi:hypothetical protein
VQAADAPRLADALAKRVFLFGGTDLSRDSQSLWAGFVAAPVGRLDDDEIRLRVMGGLSQYRYHTTAVPGGVNRGDASSGEIMLGWHRGFANAAITAYLGAHAEDHRLRNADPDNPVNGSKVGVKGVLEVFWRPLPAQVVTASASASTVYGKYQARATYAHEFSPFVSAGIEGSMLGDLRYVEPRAGLFVTTTIATSSVTLSGGFLSNSDRGDGAYLTLSIYAPF